MSRPPGQLSWLASSRPASFVGGKLRQTDDAWERSQIYNKRRRGEWQAVLSRYQKEVVYVSQHTATAQPAGTDRRAACGLLPAAGRLRQYPKPGAAPARRGSRDTRNPHGLGRAAGLVGAQLQPAAGR